MLTNILIISLFTFFLNATTKPGMINEWVVKYTFNWPEWLKKPIYSCPICMTVYYGAFLFLLGLITYTGILHSILTVFCSGGLNYIFLHLFSYVDDE